MGPLQPENATKAGLLMSRFYGGLSSDVVMHVSNYTGDQVIGGKGAAPGSGGGGGSSGSCGGGGALLTAISTATGSGSNPLPAIAEMPESERTRYNNGPDQSKRGIIATSPTDYNPESNGEIENGEGASVVGNEDDDENEDEDEESDEDEGNKEGLKISKNKRSSKKIGDLDVAVLKDENPVSMMIKTGHKGNKMKDMLSAEEGQRVEYSVFSSQKKTSTRQEVQTMVIIGL